MPAEAVLHASDLWILRGDRDLVRGLSLTAQPGEMIRVRGPNGSGKTSLLRTLAGLTLPEEGQVTWRGTDIRRDGGRFRSETLFLGHQFGLKSELTPEENLSHHQRIRESAQSRRVTSALTSFGLDAHHRQACRYLSAGQRRRVALARLLVEPATLWILDEPFTALDTDAIATLSALIVAHLGDGGLAIVTSHQTIEIPDIAIRDVALGHD